MQAGTVRHEPRWKKRRRKATGAERARMTSDERLRQQKAGELDREAGSSRDRREQRKQRGEAHEGEQKQAG